MLLRSYPAIADARRAIELLCLLAPLGMPRALDFPVDAPQGIQIWSWMSNFRIAHQNLSDCCAKHDQEIPAILDERVADRLMLSMAEAHPCTHPQKHSLPLLLVVLRC